MVWNEKIAEIGKMIGGWMKTCQKRVNHIFQEKIKFQKMLEAYKRCKRKKKENKEVILF